MISFELTSEQEKLKEEARSFAERVIKPRAKEIDEKDEFPLDVWKEMGKLPYRYTGHMIPVEFGGYPRPLLDCCIIIEEITTHGRSPICTVLLELVTLGTQPIILGGSKEQKRKYLPIVAEGRGLCAFALTEPGTGSDARSIGTKAELRGDKYLINGRKRYISFAHQADFIIVFARTEPEKGARGVSAFIVDKDTPGSKVLERIPTMGLKGHQDEELLFKNCKIPKENLLGKKGKGFYYAMRTLDKTRTTLTSGFIGLARAALDEAVGYAKEREVFGKTLAERQRFNMKFADVATEIDAARLLNYRAAWLSDQGERHTVETAKAKILATHTMLKAVNLAVEVHGGFGCTKRHIVEKYYRDARIWSFAQGTEDIMRIIVARNLLDMPRLA